MWNADSSPIAGNVIS